MPRYRAYGLEIESSRPIPGLYESSLTHPADLFIELGSAPPWRDAVFSGDIEQFYAPVQDAGIRASGFRAGGALYRISYSDGTDFYLDAAAGRLWATWDAAYSFEWMSTYLVGPIMGFVLRLRGKTCLHASAFALDGGAVVLLGQHGAGKSTTAAALAMYGYRLLTDDIVVLQRGPSEAFTAEPGYPRVNLWPDSVALLFDSPEALPLIAPDWHKRYLDVSRSFRTQAATVRSVCVLEPPSDARKTAMDKVQDAGALLALLANCYSGYLSDSETKARDFAMLHALAISVPIYRYALPRNGTVREIIDPLVSIPDN